MSSKEEEECLGRDLIKHGVVPKYRDSPPDQEGGEGGHTRASNSAEDKKENKKKKEKRILQGSHQGPGEDGLIDAFTGTKQTKLASETKEERKEHRWKVGL